MLSSKLVIVAAGTTTALAALAPAAMIDLTQPNSSGSVNGALFQTTNIQPTGTGVIDPFVRLQNNGLEQGYNTSASNMPFDEKPGIWTHDLRLSDMGGRVVDGVPYYEFLLDINQASGGDNRLLSLDAIQIYTSPLGGQSTTNVASLGALRYNLDAGGDNWIKLDYSLNSGSGSGDMHMLVPVSLFATTSSNSFVYLFSAFGTHHSANAGFEEWAASRDPVQVPAPGAFALIGVGTFAMARRRR